MMSVKKPIPSLCKLGSIYEEKPEEVLDVSDLYNWFYRKIFDNSQSEHRIVLLSIKSKKKVFRDQIVPSLRFEDTAALYPPKEVNVSERELSFLV